MAGKSKQVAGDPETAFHAAAFEVADPSALPFEAKAAKPAAPQHSLALQAGVLAFFTVTRALHPLIISQTKVNGRYPHEPLSVPLAECVLTFVVAQVMVFAKSGMQGWRDIWRPRPMAVFSIIAVIFAIGDFLELASLGSVSGTVYQLFCQSKLIITAGLLWVVKGTRQTGLQWILLVLLTLALCVDAIMRDILMRRNEAASGGGTAGGESAKESGFSVGIMLVLLKVVISCLGAVVSDKTFKGYAHEPLYVQLVRFKPVWALGLLVVLVSKGGVQEGGFSNLFHDWQGITVLALVSFTVKCWISFYVLAILDSLAKNIGEACSVLVTYFIVIFHWSFDDEYETETFMTVLLVFVCILAYLLSKGIVAKAEKYDQAVQKELAAPLQS